MARRKSSGKWAASVIIVVLLVAVAVGGMWIYYDSQLKASEARASALQSQLAARAVTPAYLELTGANNFNFTAEIDANGGVAADDTWDAGPSPTLNITNKDTRTTATNIYITMWDPLTSKGGVPTALADTTISFYVTWNGVLYPLYLCEEGVGTYTNGVNIASLPIGSQVTGITFSAKVDAAPDDTYDDTGASYTIKVFVYQADAQHSMPVSYTLYT